VSELLLADGTSYTFAYEQTPGSSGSVTGRIASVKLPSGGTVSFTYSGSGTGISNGIVCADGSTAGLSVQTPDGTTTYARSQGSGSAWTTTITAADAHSSQTVVAFQETSNNFYETSRTIYQGSSSLLKTIAVCYNGDKSAPNCSADAITLPILSKAVYVGLPSLSGLQSERAITYNNYGLVTGVSSYDYGSSAPGALLSKRTIVYGGPIVSQPLSATIADGSGNTVAQTTYAYDQSQPTGTSGTPQHLSGTGGNLTSVTQWVSSSKSLSYSFTYFDTGMVKTATDANGGQTTYTYGACGNSFPTSIQGPTGLITQEAWSCSGGVVLSSTDPNSQTSQVNYIDPYFWRPGSTIDPLGNSTNYTYTGADQSEAVLTFNNGSSVSDSAIALDSLGRNSVSQRRQAPGSSTFDSMNYVYDSMGRLSTTTLPYAGSLGSTNSSGAGTTVSYDALNRKVQVSDSGGGWKAYSYSQNDTLITLGPAPSGENLKKRQYEYDGLGRLTSVCEITSVSGSGTCAQNSAATGYWTKYTYNALGKILTVTQNAQSSGSQQTRSFTYDGLGRLISETNPETANTAQSYVYDSDSSCGTSNGDLVKKVDPVGNVSCISYDLAHRPLQVTYSGPYAANTPAKHFVYDSATVNGVAMSNAKGRLVEAYTGASASKITDLGFSYSARGELIGAYEKTPNSGGYYYVNTSYWANGALSGLGLSLGANSLIPNMTYGADGEGRPYTVNASSGQNPITSTSYNPASQVTGISYGSLDADAFGFDPNTGRPTSYQFQVNSLSVTGATTWNPNGSLGALSITDPYNTANSQSCAYSHDDLGRTASTNCAGSNPWVQSFTYDAFGNISKSGSVSFVAGYSPSTNQISSGIPSVSYDINGNLTSIQSDILHNYSWDADGNQIWADGVTITYDALDRAVEQSRSGAYAQIIYIAGTTKLALVAGGALQKAFVPLPSGATAVYNSTGLAYYRHPDWLGSSRMASRPNRTLYYSGAYAPFGESYSETGTTDRSFTGQNQDTSSSQYDFLFRSYSAVQGRWNSPDPLGVGAVQPGNPQTWNRYAYVGNMPLQSVDSLGLSTSCYGGMTEFDCMIAVQESGGGGGDGSISMFGWGDGQGTWCGDKYCPYFTPDGCVVFANEDPPRTWCPDPPSSPLTPISSHGAPTGGAGGGGGGTSNSNSPCVAAATANFQAAVVAAGNARSWSIFRGTLYAGGGAAGANILTTGSIKGAFGAFGARLFSGAALVASLANDSISASPIFDGIRQNYEDALLKCSMQPVASH
jgi:RHS repeat-associated protein